MQRLSRLSSVFLLMGGVVHAAGIQSARNSASTSAHNSASTSAHNSASTGAHNSASTGAKNSAATSAHNSASTSAHNGMGTVPLNYSLAAYGSTTPVVDNAAFNNYGDFAFLADNGLRDPLFSLPMTSTNLGNYIKNQNATYGTCTVAGVEAFFSFMNHLSAAFYLTGSGNYKAPTPITINLASVCPASSQALQYGLTTLTIGSNIYGIGGYPLGNTAGTDLSAKSIYTATQCSGTAFKSCNGTDATLGDKVFLTMLSMMNNLTSSANPPWGIDPPVNLLEFSASYTDYTNYQTQFESYGVSPLDNTFVGDGFTLAPDADTYIPINILRLTISQPTNVTFSIAEAANAPSQCKGLQFKVTRGDANTGWDQTRMTPLGAPSAATCSAKTSASTCGGVSGCFWQPNVNACFTSGIPYSSQPLDFVPMVGTGSDTKPLVVPMVPADSGIYSVFIANSSLTPDNPAAASTLVECAFADPTAVSPTPIVPVTVSASGTGVTSAIGGNEIFSNQELVFWNAGPAVGPGQDLFADQSCHATGFVNTANGNAGNSFYGGSGITTAQLKGGATGGGCGWSGFDNQLLSSNFHAAMSPALYDGLFSTLSGSTSAATNAASARMTVGYANPGSLTPEYANLVTVDANFPAASVKRTADGVTVPGYCVSANTTCTPGPKNSCYDQGYKNCGYMSYGGGKPTVYQGSSTAITVRLAEICDTFGGPAEYYYDSSGGIGSTLASVSAVSGNHVAYAAIGTPPYTPAYSMCNMIQASQTYAYQRNGSDTPLGQRLGLMGRQLPLQDGIIELAAISSNMAAYDSSGIAPTLSSLENPYYPGYLATDDTPLCDATACYSEPYCCTSQGSNNTTAATCAAINCGGFVPGYCSGSFAITAACSPYTTQSACTGAPSASHCSWMPNNCSDAGSGPYARQNALPIFRQPQAALASWGVSSVMTNDYGPGYAADSLRIDLGYQRVITALSVDPTTEDPQRIDDLQFWVSNDNVNWSEVSEYHFPNDQSAQIIWIPVYPTQARYVLVHASSGVQSSQFQLTLAEFKAFGPASDPANTDPTLSTLAKRYGVPTGYESWTSDAPGGEYTSY